MVDVETRVFALLDAREGAALTLEERQKQAASAAIEAYGPEIHDYLSRRLPDPDDALDVFSQWSEDLWHGLPGFRRECRLRTWAYKLAYHAFARFRRDPYRARRERLPSSAASRLAVSVAQSSMLSNAARREQYRKLEARLTEDERELLQLHNERELPFDDCAEILSAGGTPVTAVTLRKRYQRIKEKLKDLLDHRE